MRAAFGHVHHSSRFDRTGTSLLRSTKRFLLYNSIITVTEVNNPARAKYLNKIPGWRFVHVHGPDNMGDCGILVNRLKWAFIKQKVTKHGNDVWSITVWLRNRRTGQILIVSVIHLPAHVETLMRDNRFNAPSVAYYRGCLDDWHEFLLAKKANWPRASVMAVADWNLDMKKSWVRGWLNDHFKGFTSSWETEHRVTHDWPAGGTHGTRIIDDTRYARLGLRKINLTQDDASSDHRPYREVLLLPEKDITA